LFVVQDMVVELAALLVLVVVVAASLAVAAVTTREWLERRSLLHATRRTRQRLMQEYAMACALPEPPSAESRAAARRPSTTLRKVPVRTGDGVCARSARA
jgi:hypothetical protein